MAKIELAKLDIDIEALLEKIEEVTAAMAKLREQQLLLADASKKLNPEIAGQKEQLEAINDTYKKNTKLIKDLSSEYEGYAKAVKSQTSETNKFITNEEGVAKTLSKEVSVMREAQKEILALKAMRDQLGTASSNEEGQIASINAKLTENTGLIKGNAAQTEDNKEKVKDYLDQIKEGAEKLNIFNGGFTALVTRAKEAGGVGNLVKESFDMMSGGVKNLTVASLEFIATPIGAIIAAIGLVLSPIISYLTSTEEGMKKVNAVTEPLKAVFEALTVIFQKVGKYLLDAFSNPKKTLTELAQFVQQNLLNRFKAFGKILDGIIHLDFKKIADGTIQAATGVENAIDKTKNLAKAAGDYLIDAAKKGTKIHELQQKLDDTLTDYKKNQDDLNSKLNEQKKIINDTSKTDAQRIAAAKQSIETAKAVNKLTVDRLNTEIELLKTRMSLHIATEEEKQQLNELVKKRKEANDKMTEQSEAMENKITDILKAAEQKREALRQKAIADAAEKMKLELDIFVQTEGHKLKTLKEELKYAEDLRDKKLAIAQEEFNRSKKDANAGLKLQKAQNDAQEEYLNTTAAATAKYAKADFDLWMQNHQSKINSETHLTDAVIEEEKRRLEAVKAHKVQLLELEKKTNAEIIAYKEAHNQDLTLQEIEFKTGLSQINQENQQANDQLDQQRAEAKAQEEAAQYETKKALADNEYEVKVMEEDERHKEETDKYQQWRDDELISNEQYQALIKASDEETAKNKMRLALMKKQAEIGVMQNVASALGEAFGQSKELAIVQANMSAAQAILSIWSGQISGNPVVDAIIKGVLTATTAISTAKQIQKIKSAKKPKDPKFETGGLMQIGGKRHSAGGTMFTGEDGTTFEAEQGELIGVMNRNAARHFMAFNNAYPSGAGSVPNFFASGGIVSRQVPQSQINMQDFANATANAIKSMPAPVVSVHDIVTEGNSYVKVRDYANF